MQTRRVPATEVAGTLGSTLAAALAPDTAPASELAPPIDSDRRRLAEARPRETTVSPAKNVEQAPAPRAGGGAPPRSA